MKKISMLMIAVHCCIVLLAQSTTGIIKGQIETADNKPAENVTVTIQSIKRSTITADDGSFVLRNIAPGTYQLESSLVSYATMTKEITVQAGKTTEVAIHLNISDQQLQEVIVRSGTRNYKTNTLSSSLRLQTPILETPQNIQVVTNKAIADQQIISMSDGVVRNVSGTVRNEHWGDLYTNITSRGSQIQAFRNGFNVVSSFWGPLTEDMSIVDHIEFVKGPAGFMLANGDPGGLYNVVTKKPTGQTKGEAGFTIGSFDLYRSTLDIDGKLSKDGRLLYRFNLAAQQKKSHRAFEYNNRYTIAPVISYQVDDKTKLTFEYTYQNAKMSDVGSFYVFSTQGFATLPRNFTSMAPGIDPTKINDHNVYVNMQRQLSSQWKLTGQLAYFNYKQTGSSSWPGAVNPDGTMIRGISSWDAKSQMNLGQVFINGEAKTGAVSHKILGGIDVANKEYMADWSQYHELDLPSLPFDTHNPDYGIPVNGYPAFDHTTPLEQRAQGGVINQRYSGLYVQDESGFLENRIRLTVAGRYTYVKQSEYGGTPYDAKHVTPRVGLSVSIDKQTSAYALYDQAFLPQTGTLLSGKKVQPITGSNIEFGIKRDWAGGKWNTTLAVYRIIKNNELASYGPVPNMSIELGQKRAQGIEFDLRGRIINGLNLLFNYAYTDSKITKITDNAVTDFKVGDPVPSFVRHTTNSWLNYKIQDGALKGLGASAGFTYLAKRFTFWDASPDPSQQLPDYFKLDAGLFWEKDQLTITANVFNVLNEYLYSGSYYKWLSAYYWQTDAPRNLRLSISYRF